MNWLKHLFSPHKPPFPREEEIEFKIARLEMKPGDVLVIRSKERLPRVMIDRLGDLVKPILRGNKCLILDGGLDLAVLTPAEIEARLS